MKLRMLLPLLVVACLVGYGGLKGYLYYQVKAGVDRIVRQLQPFASVRYEEVGTGLGLSGVVTVEGISIIPNGAVEVVRIGALELVGDDITFLLKMVGGLKLEEPPEQLRMTAYRVELPLDEGFLVGVSDEDEAARPAPCSLGGILRHSGLEQLNYPVTLADMQMGYRLRTITSELAVDFSYRLHGVEALRLEFTLSGVTAAGALMAGTMPQLSSGLMTYQFASDYTRGMVNYCANVAGMTPAAFLKQLFSIDDTGYADSLGFVPGAGIRTALSRMVGQSAEAKVMINPVAGVDLFTLSTLPPEALIEQLGLTLAVGGQGVSDLSFSLPMKRGGSPGSLAGQRAGDGSAAPVGKPRYIETGVAGLARYQGYDVRIYTRGQAAVKQGILSVVRAQEMEVEQRIHGGKMTMLIPFDKVERAEVYRRQ